MKLSIKKFSSIFEELIIKILSYLNINHINKLELPFSYHKHYLIERNILKNNNWYVGVYNNIYDHCFTCKTHLDKNLRVLVICMNCEFTLDNYYCYPVVCINSLMLINLLKEVMFLLVFVLAVKILK